MAELIGTGYVARDMMQIVDALHEGGLLNYWGFSYGSTLGATVAAMFPERMGKVVLDGVLNPLDYFSGRDISQLTATDLSFDGFFTGCVANPEMCALAQLTMDAGELSEKVYGLIYHLKYNPFVTGPDAVSDIIDYTFLKNAIQSVIINPSTWPLFSTGLHGLLTENITEARTLSFFTAPQPTIFPNNGKEATPAIRFSDVPRERVNTTSFDDILEEFYATSKLLGDFFSSLPPSYRDWPFRAKGAYLGDFRVKTRNPLLFVGGALDPLTPLPNAYNASAGFEGSVVLEHGGYGVSLYLSTLHLPNISFQSFFPGTLKLNMTGYSIHRHFSLRCAQQEPFEPTSSMKHCPLKALNVSLCSVFSPRTRRRMLWRCLKIHDWRMVI